MKPWASSLKRTGLDRFRKRQAYPLGALDRGHDEPIRDGTLLSVENSDKKLKEPSETNQIRLGSKDRSCAVTG